MGFMNSYGRGRIIGIRIGEEEGTSHLDEALFRQTADHVELIAKNTGCTVEKAMDILEVVPARREQVLTYLKHQKAQQEEES